jgi:hypothetical protein
VRAVLARRGKALMDLDATGREDLRVLQETRDLVPLLMHDVAALHIQTCVRAARQLGGVMAEAGVFMGGSARLICAAKGDVPLHLFDVFEALQAPPGTSGDEAGVELRAHFGSIHGRRDQVERLLSPYGDVHLHPGIFPASATGLEHEWFSFVHLDMDLVRSTADALSFFHPRLVQGGILIGDDYADPGVRGAFADFFADRSESLIGLPWGQVMVVKQES